MAGDVPVWPDNMALMTVKGGCLQGLVLEFILECYLEGTGISAESRKEKGADQADFLGIDIVQDIGESLIADDI